MVSDSWRARLAKIDRCPVCGAWRYAGRCPAAACANHRRGGGPVRSCTVGESARRHPCSAWHYGLVESYRAARDAAVLAFDEATYGHAAEAADYLDRGGRRPITFREWLIAHAGTSRPD